MKGVRKGAWERALSGGKIAAKLAGKKLLGLGSDTELGEVIAGELDQMKGMAMKVGQIVSYFDGILPEETHVALRALQKGATAVEWPRMEKVIVEAFGAPVSTLFERFDTTPIASASIGQVYRARHAGTEVAVKVQYPDIRVTMASDFSRLTSLSKMASLATQVDGPSLVRELHARIDEECNYEQEAENVRFFADAFAGDASIVLLRAIPERTKPTVITTPWSNGESFCALAERADQAAKNRVAHTLVHFAFRSIFELGAVNADPHPGNYLFDGERVVFLDFGCVRRFDRSFVDAYHRLISVTVRDERSRFEEALAATGMIGDPRGFDYEAHWKLLRHEFAPYISPHFAFDRSWFLASRQHAKVNARKLAIPAQWIWLERLIWGLHAVLVRLGAEGDFRAHLRTSG